VKLQGINLELGLEFRAKIISNQKRVLLKCKRKFDFVGDFVTSNYVPNELKVIYIYLPVILIRQECLAYRGTAPA